MMRRRLFKKGLRRNLVLVLFVTVSLTSIPFVVAKEKKDEEEFVNPLPEDKFVFVEIKQINKTTAPISIPIPELPPTYSFGVSKKILFIECEEEFYRPDEKTMIIIAHSVDWLHTGYDVPYYHKIDKLSYSISLPPGLSYIPEEEWFDHTIIITDITVDGSVEIMHKWMKKGKSQEKIIRLRPQEDYSFSDKKYIKKVPVHDYGPLTKGMFKINIDILNHGIWDKKENVRILYWDVGIQKYIKRRWDSQEGEYIKEDN